MCYLNCYILLLIQLYCHLERSLREVKDPLVV
jgi:hypothetical protein